LECIIPESVFSCFSHSEFLVLTQNIPRVIISDKNVAEVMWYFWNIQ